MSELNEIMYGLGKLSRIRMVKILFVAVLAITVYFWFVNKPDRKVVQESPAAPTPTMSLRDQVIADAKMLPAPAMSPESCNVSDFTLEKVSSSIDDVGVGHVYGLVTNHCQVAKGLQLELIAFDRHENIVSSDKFWPASISNIPPNKSHRFSWIVMQGFSHAHVQVVDTKAW